MVTDLGVRHLWNITTSKGRPNKMSYAGDRMVWICTYRVMLLIFQGTL
jgi:hypothetical protein